MPLLWLIYLMYRELIPWGRFSSPLRTNIFLCIVTVDYASKWVDVIPVRGNETRVVVSSHEFFRCTMPCPIISD